MRRLLKEDAHIFLFWLNTIIVSLKILKFSTKVMFMLKIHLSIRLNFVLTIVCVADNNNIYGRRKKKNNPTWQKKKEK